VLETQAVAVQAKLGGVVGALQLLVGMTSIPRMLGFVCGAPDVPAVNAIVIEPLLSAVAENCLTVALNCAPASAKIS